MVLAIWNEIVLADDPTSFFLGMASRARLTDRRPDTLALLEQLRMTIPREERADLLQQLATELADDAILIFLEYRDPTEPHYSTLIGPRVQGLADPDTSMMSDRRQRVRQMWVTDD